LRQREREGMSGEALRGWQKNKQKQNCIEPNNRIEKAGNEKRPKKMRNVSKLFQGHLKSLN